MKAWQFTNTHEPLILVDVEVPEPGPGEVVIDVKAAGLCHSDVGMLEDEGWLRILTKRPITPGHEVAGVISALGDGVTEWKVGDRVGICPTTEVGAPGYARDGGFAYRTVTPAISLVRIPDRVSFALGAAGTDGVTQPYRDTAERLSRALQLTGQVDIRFKAAARRAPRRRPDATSADRPEGDRARHNLPPPTTSFVGREDELAMVKTRLRESRLLTITGSGGCGKTRLAIEAAGQMVGEFHNGVWLVDLAPLSDPSLIWHALASVLAMSEEPSRPLADAVVDYLRGRSNLIILDNCEHLIDVCATTVDTLLQEVPMVRLLATSRELLGVPGEAAWRVRSLTVVHPEELVSTSGDFVDIVLGSEAARLFVDRAHLLNPSFELSSDNAHAVAQICRRLDGIPLAIELAAARLTSLSVTISRADWTSGSGC